MIYRILMSLLCTVLVMGFRAVPARCEAVAEVTTTTLQKGSLPVTTHAYGHVEASADARRTIMAPLSATIEEVLVRQGAEVAKDTPLIRLMPSPQEAAAYSQAQTALQVARELVQRTRKMVRQHLVTGQQLAQAQKSKSDAQAALAALKTQGADGPVILRAPFAAIVTTVSVQQGAIVARGTTLLDLSRPDDLVLKAGVVPAKAATIGQGDPARVTLIGGSRSFSGKVVLCGAIVDPVTGLVPVEIALPAGKFFPGESAEAAIATSRAEGYLVPHAAILVDEKGGTYVVQAVGGAAKMVPVHILAAGADQNVIVGRLDATAPLVLTGNYQLEEGMKLRIAPPGKKAAS